MFSGKGRQLLSSRNYWLCAEPSLSKKDTLSWDRSEAKACEKWEIEEQPDHSYAFRGKRGLYITTACNGVMDAKAKTVGPHQKFSIEEVSSGMYTIKSCATQKYVRDTGASPICDGVEFDESILVRIHPYLFPGGSRKGLYCPRHDHYLSAEADGRANWNRGKLLAWEEWTIEEHNGKWAFMGVHGKYLTVSSSGPRYDMSVKATSVGEHELFTIVPFDSSPKKQLICLLAFNGKFVSAEPKGGVKAEMGHKQEWEKFRIIDAS